MDREGAIRDYFRAFQERDRAALQLLLPPDFRRSSPFGLHEDRDRMLDKIWPDVGRHWAEDVEIYGDGPDYMALLPFDRRPDG